MRRLLIRDGCGLFVVVLILMILSVVSITSAQIPPPPPPNEVLGTGMRIIRADIDPLGYVNAGKIYGVAAKIPYTDPQLQALQGGKTVFAYVGSEQYFTNNPDDTELYIRWGWTKIYQAGTGYLVTLM